MVKCWFIYYIIALPLYWWLVPIMIHWSMHQANHFHYLTMSLLIEAIAYTNIQGNCKRVCHHFANLPVAIIHHLYRLDHLTLNDILIWYRTYIILWLNTNQTFFKNAWFCRWYSGIKNDILDLTLNETTQMWETNHLQTLLRGNLAIHLVAKGISGP